MQINVMNESKINLDTKIKIEQTNQEQKNNIQSAEKTSSSSSGYNENVEKTIDELNGKFRIFGKQLSYKLHEDTNRYIVSVEDMETGDVIKEIPSEESLDFIAKMIEMSGLILDKKS